MAMVFLAPYALLFLAFVVYPVGYALWMGSAPSLYAALAADPFYLTTLVNTLVFVLVGANATIALALLLSGFFARRRRWIKGLLVIFVLPWMLPAVQTAISFRWMLGGEDGMVDRILSVVFGIDGPIWFNHRWLALGANIAAYAWKWLPLWTAVFLAGRMAIPRDIADAAAVDGASGVRRFVHVTFPLLANRSEE